jgi:hypothetical protein
MSTQMVFKVHPVGCICRYCEMARALPETPTQEKDVWTNDPERATRRGLYS